MDDEWPPYEEKWMLAALELANDAYGLKEVPVGCVLVHNGEIIGKGRNQPNASCNATRHAEIEAADEVLLERKLGKEVFKDAVLYVTVEPCVMCAAALRLLGRSLVHVSILLTFVVVLGVRKCYYGCTNERFGGCGSVLDVHSRPAHDMNTLECRSGFLRDEAIAILRKFYLNENSNGAILSLQKGIMA